MQHVPRKSRTTPIAGLHPAFPASRFANPSSCGPRHPCLIQAPSARLQGIQSVPNMKVFSFGGQTIDKSDRSLWSYTSEISMLDTGN
jgi:hypothetical protein